MEATRQSHLSFKKSEELPFIERLHMIKERWRWNNDLQTLNFPINKSLGQTPRVLDGELNTRAFALKTWKIWHSGRWENIICKWNICSAIHNAIHNKQSTSSRSPACSEPSQYLPNNKNIKCVHNFLVCIVLFVLNIFHPFDYFSNQSSHSISQARKITKQKNCVFPPSVPPLLE